MTKSLDYFIDRNSNQSMIRRRKSIHCTRSGRIQDFHFRWKIAANINTQFEAMCYLEYTCKNRSCQLYMCTMSHSVDVHANTACQEHITIEVAIRQSCHLNANFTHTHIHTSTHTHIHTFTHTHTHTLTHSHIHTFTHSRTHTITHPHTHTFRKEEKNAARERSMWWDSGVGGMSSKHVGTCKWISPPCGPWTLNPKP